MNSPKIILTAPSSEWQHSIWQQMLAAAIPAKFGHRWVNPATQINEFRMQTSGISRFSINTAGELSRESGFAALENL